MTDLRDQLQTSLGAAYTLERELGGGGMSRVFVATEASLGRAVVVKVLPPEMAAGVSTERFKREISVAARLQHPHIVPLLSAGEMDGIPYFTMPFVKGESLRTRLARRGELPVNEAVRVLREIASALAYAHANGVAHRDIKPDNVLFSDDVAMVTDFGVAKALSASTNGDSGGMTSLGVALGTPAYMAPEQATADPATDHRADIYAFGVLAYEMLTGQPPFVGRNPSQLLAAHVTEAPEPIGRRRPNLPPALAALVMRCLEKRAADRPQSASEIVHALDDITTPSGGMQPTTARERVAGTSSPGLAVQDASTSAAGRRVPTGGVVLAIVVTALAVLGVVVWRRGPVAREPGAGPTRVAVLPFENLGDSADAYFADGITDAVRGKLSELPTLQVTARSSAGQYRHSTKTPRDIGNELGVQYILTATVRWEKQTGGASRVQVSPELVQVSTASTKWQQPFDASMTDVFQVQADIAGRVASALNVALGDQAKAQLAVRPTANIPAYDAFLKGEEISNRMSENDPAVLRRAADYYEQATALDPTFALAWAQLARSHAIIYFNGVPSPEEADAAKRAAERALVLAPDRPESHLAMGAYYSNIPKDYARELAEYESTLRTAPADADLLTAAALAEESLGRWDDALKHLEQATRLDPRSPLPARRLGTVRQYQRRFPEALAAFDHALQLAPTNFAALEGKMMVSLAQGDLAGARAVLAGAGTGIDPAKLVAYIANYQDLFWVLDDAQQQLLLRLSPTPFDEDRSAWGVALTETYALRGDQTKARAYADSALISIDAQLRATPDDAQRHSIRGLVLAYLGRKAEAIAEGERGVTLMPVSKDAFLGAYLQHELVRIYLLVNEPEKALAHLEPLLRIPYALSPGWLRIDPTFAPLKGNPRFERLVAGR